MYRIFLIFPIVNTFPHSPLKVSTFSHLGSRFVYHASSFITFFFSLSQPKQASKPSSFVHLLSRYGLFSSFRPTNNSQFTILYTLNPHPQHPLHHSNFNSLSFFSFPVSSSSSSSSTPILHPSRFYLIPSYSRIHIEDLLLHSHSTRKNIFICNQKSR